MTESAAKERFCHKRHRDTEKEKQGMLSVPFVSIASRFLPGIYTVMHNPGGSCGFEI